jgi:hypothetical protein
MWYANCAWDVRHRGRPHVDCDIETACPDCGEAIQVAVRDKTPDDEGLVFHVLVPAARWWADIGFT